MSQGTKHRVLVVDDEAAVRNLMIGALNRQAFQCDSAADGNEAEERLSHTQYDCVVTDLRMPNKHGHALATYLLTLERRPVIVVHTGVVEPRLAKDLLARGVDDIVFKPFDFNILAAKLRVLVDRRFPSLDSNHSRTAPTDSVALLSQNRLLESSDEEPVRLPCLEERLSGLGRLLPISHAALDVYKMTNDDATQASQLAAAIQRDAAFAAEVLRLANSSFYNLTKEPVVQLDRAVMRIGQTRIGELALAMNALAALTSDTVPWMDVRLTWKQSMAAGLAVEMLIEQGGHGRLEGGLLLNAIMHSLGRVALGTLYPRQYERMIKACQVSGESLEDQERIAFPLNHAAALARLLTTWNVPKEVQTPLKYLLKDYSELAKAPEPLRTKVELVKLAAFLARIAVGRWEPWDLVEFPPASLFHRLEITDVPWIVTKTREDVERLASFNSERTTKEKTTYEPQPGRRLGCCNLSNDAGNFLEMILPSMGIAPVIYTPGDLADAEETVVVNCIGTATHRMAALPWHRSQMVIVTDSGRADRFRDYERTILLPSSYSRLRSALWEASSPMTPTSEPAGSTFAQWA